jgi:DNA-binding response OmpR family regulator
MSDLEASFAIVSCAKATHTGDHPRAPVAQEPRKIVIVDDNRDAADALGVHLQAAGYQVMVTYSGKEAWQTCKAFLPSVMVVDIGMPRLNGFQLARRIRRTGWGMDALLIAVTGWGRSGDTQLAKFVGFDHYCEKPIDFLEIERLVQSTVT